MDQREFRLFNVIDDYKREGLVIEAGFSLPSIRVTQALDQLIERRGKPSVTRCDNSPELINYEFTSWAERHKLELNISSQVTHSRMRILSGLIEPSL